MEPCDCQHHSVENKLSLSAKFEPVRVGDLFRFSGETMRVRKITAKDYVMRPQVCKRPDQYPFKVGEKYILDNGLWVKVRKITTKDIHMRLTVPDAPETNSAVA